VFIPYVMDGRYIAMLILTRRVRSVPGIQSIANHADSETEVCVARIAPISSRKILIRQSRIQGFPPTYER
jgi:hypothetical protein